MSRRRGAVLALLALAAVQLASPPHVEGTVATDTSSLRPDTVPVPQALVRAPIVLPSPIDPEGNWYFFREEIRRAPHARVDSVGTTAARRPLDAITVGSGEAVVMVIVHPGDLTGAGTRATARLLAYLGSSQEVQAERLRQRFTLVAVPLLNPDGVAHGVPRNAQGLALERDGRVVASPEITALLRLAEARRPAHVVWLEPADLGATGRVELAVEDDPTSPLSPLGERGAAVAHLRVDASDVLAAEAAAMGFLWRYLHAAMAGAEHASAELGPTAAAPDAAAVPQGDILVRGGTVYLAGLPPFAADLLLRRARLGGGVHLVEVGDLAGRVTASDTIEAAGRRVVVFDPQSFPGGYAGRPFVDASVAIHLSVQTDDRQARVEWLTFDERLIQEQQQLWEDRSGFFFSVLVPGSGAGRAGVARSLVRVMDEGGWGHDFDQRYPTSEEGTAFVGSAGMWLSSELSLEVLAVMPLRGSAQGANLDRGSMLTLSYEAVAASLFASLPVRGVRVGAGAAWLAGDYAWTSRVSHRSEGRFEAWGAALDLTAPMLRIGRRVHTEFRMHGQLFLPYTIEEYAGHPGGGAPVRNLFAGISLILD